MSKTSSRSVSGRRRRGVDRKREILAAAREVFSAKGYDQASIAEIASKVGIVEGAIYKHFTTKRELLFEATHAFYRPVIEQTREQLRAIRGARNRLRFLIWRQLLAFAEQPGFCRLIIQDVRPHRDYQNSVVHELNRESTSLALGILEEAREQGEFRSDLSAEMVRDVIFGGIEHVMWKALSGHGVPDIDGLAEDLTELILRGVEVRSGESRAAGAREDGERSDRVSLLRGEQLESRIDRLERRLNALSGKPGSRASVRRGAPGRRKETGLTLSEEP